MASPPREAGRALRLMELPSAIWGCIAEHLGSDTESRCAPPPPPLRRRLPPLPTHRCRLSACRVRLAATCRALRAASAGWYRNDVFVLDATSLSPAPQRLSWLGRVAGEVLPLVVLRPCSSLCARH